MTPAVRTRAVEVRCKHGHAFIKVFRGAQGAEPEFGKCSTCGGVVRVTAMGECPIDDAEDADIDAAYAMFRAGRSK